jgi:deoxycytidine triphosphate deaminase
MSVVDLNSRLTDNWEAFSRNVNSSDSYVYIDTLRSLSDGPSSLELSIGIRCFVHKEAKYYAIPEDGLRLAPFQSILIETKQSIALPNNIFGLVTGKGTQIFAGAFLSTGKIDPGFNGNLKIGFYNGSPESIYLKTGDSLCSCVFLQTESNLIVPQRAASGGYYKIKSLSTFRQRALLWVKANSFWLPIIISIIAALGTWGNAIINGAQKFFK